MTPLGQLLTVLLPVGYLLAALLHGAAFAGARSVRVERLRTWSFRLTLLAHVGWAFVRWRQVGHFPVDDPWTVLSGTILTVALVYGWLARDVKDPGSGGVVLGLLFLLQLVTSGFCDLRPVHDDAPVSQFRILHISTSLLAAAALLLSGTHGILYLVLFRQMRLKRFGPLFNHLPDLTTLARMTRRSALAGFVCLTIGLNVGIFMAHRDQTAGFEYSDPHVLLTLFLWVHFGVIAFSRHIYGLSARRASVAAAAGLAMLLLSFFVPLFSSITFHSSL